MSWKGAIEAAGQVEELERDQREHLGEWAEDYHPLQVLLSIQLFYHLGVPRRFPEGATRASVWLRDFGVFERVGTSIPTRPLRLCTLLELS